MGVQPKTVSDGRPEFDSTVAPIQALALAGKVRIDTREGEITIVVPLDHEEKEKLKCCAKTPEAKNQVEEAVELVREAEKAFGGTGPHASPRPTNGNWIFSCHCSVSLRMERCTSSRAHF